MKHYIATLLLFFCLPAAATVSVVTVEALLTPMYQQWDANAKAFHQQTISVCSGDSEIAELQNRWRKTKDSWTIISALTFGPLVQNNIAMQVQFWPDKKNLVGFQIERLLKTSNQPQDNAAIDLSRVSVALRGLSAAEYIVFDSAIDLKRAEDKAQYCELLMAVGAYQENLSTITLTQWQIYLRDEFTALDDAAKTTELLRAQVSGLEVQHKKIALVLGKKIPQPYLAEHWRADYSLASLQLATQTHQKNWQTLWLSEIQSKQPELATKMTDIFARTEINYAALGPSLAQALTTPMGLDELNKLVKNFKQLQLLFSKDIAAALDVQIGFNSNDGD